MITLLSLVSFEDVSDGGIEIPYLDKMAHFIFHAVAAVLGCLSLRERSRHTMAMNKAILIMLGALLLYGIIIETIQMEFTTSRSGEVSDILANMAGALSGVLALKVRYRGKQQLKW
jgi:VanZ family protein